MKYNEQQKGQLSLLRSDTIELTYVGYTYVPGTVIRAFV